MATQNTNSEKQLSQYAEEIEAIAAYAKKVNFNHLKDDFMTLVRCWFADCQRAYKAIEADKDEAVRLVKSQIK